MDHSVLPNFDTGTCLLLAAYGLAFVMLLAGIVRQSSLNPGRHDSPPPLLRRNHVGTWWCGPVDILGLLLMSGVFISFGLTSASADAKPPEQTLTPSLLIGNIITFAVLMGAVTAMVYRRVKPSVWLGLRWSQWPHFFWIGPSAVLAMWVVLGILNSTGYISWMERIVGSSSTQEAVALMRNSKDSWSVGLMVFSATLVAPLAEEVIFRGYMYPVAKSFGGRTAGMLFSALLFAACHGNVPLMLPLFLLGILLTLAYERTGSIWAAVSIHFFFNSATVATQLALRAGWFPELPSP